MVITFVFSVTYDKEADAKGRFALSAATAFMFLRLRQRPRDMVGQRAKDHF